MSPAINSRICAELGRPREARRLSSREPLFSPKTLRLRASITSCANGMAYPSTAERRQKTSNNGQYPRRSPVVRFGILNKETEFE